MPPRRYIIDTHSSPRRLARHLSPPRFNPRADNLPDVSAIYSTLREEDTEIPVADTQMDRHIRGGPDSAYGISHLPPAGAGFRHPYGPRQDQCRRHNPHRSEARTAELSPAAERRLHGDAHPGNDRRRRIGARRDSIHAPAGRKRGCGAPDAPEGPCGHRHTRFGDVHACHPRAGIAARRLDSSAEQTG